MMLAQASRFLEADIALASLAALVVGEIAQGNGDDLQGKFILNCAIIIRDMGCHKVYIKINPPES